MKKPGLAIICLVILSLFFASVPAYAERQEVIDGLNWLKANQNTDGSWGSSSDFRDTSTVIDALNVLGETDAALTDALNWLNSIPVESNDYIARRAASFAGAGEDVNADLDGFVQTQYINGGWGYYPDYASGIYDTSLVLNAFREASFMDISVIGRAFYFLLSKQNEDGSWSFVPDAPGDVVTTSMVLDLCFYYGVMYEDEALDSGVAWLLSQQNTDGGFGNSDSTAQSTAMALNALLMSGQIQAETLNSTVNYLQLNQLPNGSWNDNAYETAVVVKTLATMKPNLSIKAANISVSDSTPKTGEIMTISAEVKNIGKENAFDVPVRILAESPANEIIELAAETIASLEIGTTSTINADFDMTGRQGDYTIIVRVDEGNGIEELSEEDNEALKQVSIMPVPDLVISNGDIVFSANSVNIGDDVTVSASITNRGNNRAEGFDVAFYYDMVSPETYIGQVYINNLEIDETTSRNIEWKTSILGTAVNIYAVIDPQNALGEVVRENNQAFNSIEVVAVTEPNLKALHTDISFNPPVADQGGSVEISAIVRNEGFSQADSVDVAFYNGDPESGGVLLGNAFIANISQGEASSVSYNWTNIHDSGERMIYLKVDPSNTVAEFNEEDNDTFAALQIRSMPDLVISSNSIVLSPSVPKDGDMVQINVTLLNTGEQSASNVTVRALEGSTVIGTQSIDLISGNSQAAALFNYDTTGKTGNRQITISVDPENAISEQIEDNNLASRTLAVQDSDLWLTEQYISPDGDGIQDSTEFFFRLDVSQTVRIVVVSENGETVRTFSGSQLEDITDGSIIWDGLDNDGMVVDDGQYQIQIIGADNNTGVPPEIETIRR
ncbi:MAG: CARDB domain-containing protein [Nitrospirota bacterium]